LQQALYLLQPILSRAANSACSAHISLQPVEHLEQPVKHPEQPVKHPEQPWSASLASFQHPEHTVEHL
jgi:hypothetical protein